MGGNFAAGFEIGCSLTMSYDIMLHYNEIPAEVPMHVEGNVIAFNPETNETGMTSAEINITWNYSKFFCEHLGMQNGGFAGCTGKQGEKPLNG